jgi:hypothetical protein
MVKQDFLSFSELWSDIHSVMPAGVTYTQRTMLIPFTALEEYPLDIIRQALTVHMKTNKFAPQPDDIIQIIDSRTGAKHIGADEAWAIAKEAMNQDNCVCTTDEIIQAMDIAYNLYQDDDETAARMAFRDAYNRIIKTANPPAWFISIGNNKAQAENVAQKAIALGRLPKGSDAKYRLEAPTTTVQKLIEGYVSHVSVAKESLAQLKEMLKPVPKPKFVFAEEHLTDEQYNALPWYLREGGVPEIQNNPSKLIN